LICLFCLLCAFLKMSLSTLRILSKFSDDHDAFLAPLFYGSLLTGCLVAGGPEGLSKPTAAGFLSLAKNINDARFTLRFWVGVKSLVGLLSPPAPEDPKSVYASSPLLASIKKAQLVLALLYNLFEVPAYLRNTAAPQLFSYDGKWFARQSALMYFFVLLLEAYASYHQFTILQKLDEKNEDKKKIVPREKFILFFKSIILACEIPLLHNWAQVEEYLSPLNVALLGSASSAIKLFLWWKKQQAELKKEDEKQK